MSRRNKQISTPNFDVALVLLVIWIAMNFVCLEPLKDREAEFH